jgi:hypothetical protein
LEQRTETRSRSVVHEHIEPAELSGNVRHHALEFHLQSDIRLHGGGLAASIANPGAGSFCPGPIGLVVQDDVGALFRKAGGQTSTYAFACSGYENDTPRKPTILR